MLDLRERFDYRAVLDAVIQPPFEDLCVKARARRRHRTALTAALVLTVAGLGVPAVTGQLTPPTQPPRGHPASTTPPTSWHFVDIRHGVLFYATPDGSVPDGCRANLRVTDNGGRSWSEQRVAPCRLDKSGDPRRAVLMLDASTLLWFAGETDAQISRDTGRTWQPHRVRTVSAEQIPVGVGLSYGCLDNRKCRTNQLTWFDRVTGNRVNLRTGPDLEEILTVPVWAQDRSLWVGGRTSDGEYAVAVSRDQGRTWQVRPIGPKIDPRNQLADSLAVATRDGQTAYLVQDDFTLDNVLFWTSDGGDTWQRVTTAAKPHSPYNWHGAYVADNEVLVLQTSGHASRWQASRDNGRSVTPLQFPPLEIVREVPGGFVGHAPSDRFPYLSEDGLTWRKAALP